MAAENRPGCGLTFFDGGLELVWEWITQNPTGMVRWGSSFLDGYMEKRKWDTGASPGLWVATNQEEAEVRRRLLEVGADASRVIGTLREFFPHQPVTVEDASGEPMVVAHCEPDDDECLDRLFALVEVLIDRGLMGTYLIDARRPGSL